MSAEKGAELCAQLASRRLSCQRADASAKPDTDKRARVIAQTDLFAGGSVRFPRKAAWLEDFTAELLAFPGRHDDQVDALTQGLAWGRHDWAYRPSWAPFED